MTMKQDELAVTEPFGRWLLRQRNRQGWIGTLAGYAAADPGFPRDGGPKQVRARIMGQAVDDDMAGALGDAVVAWRTEQSD